MNTFEKTFKDKIDTTDGTVVLNESKFKEIQKDALNHAREICLSGIETYSNLAAKYSVNMKKEIATCEDIISNIDINIKALC